MFEVLALLDELENSDVHWILDTGDERQVISSEVIIREGTKPDALYFVLDGLVAVTVAAGGNKEVARLGPGELMGEISFLENRPASATITAVENSLILALPLSALMEKIEADPRFAARFYRSFAQISARRLRERVNSLAAELETKSTYAGEAGSEWAHISRAVTEFKEQLQKADEEAIQNDGEIPEDIDQNILREFRAFCQMIYDEIGEQTEMDIHVREEIGAWLKTELLPYMLLTQTAERFYSKPRGYAGDFLTIEWIYENKPAGAGRLGPLLDKCFLNEPAARAVRNRRGLLAEEIGKVLESGEGKAQVTSLACGPAAEIFDVLTGLQNPDRFKATLIDIDLQALAFVTDRAKKLKVSRYIKAVNANLVYLATSRHELELPPQDLVYSIGLVDYFSDSFVVRLINYVHSLLKPGGKLILGNFHPSNSTRGLMDHILEWKLIHRTEEDMNRLYEKSKFGRPCTNIRFEEEGVNLFAECVRE